MTIYKRGDVWYIDYVHKGKRHRKRVGHSRKVAELTLKDIELRIERRESLGIHELRKTSFSEFAKEYLEYAKTNKARKSYVTNQGQIKAMSRHFGDCMLTEITPQTIERFKAARSLEVRPATVNRALACLKNMYNKAMLWGYAEANPMRGVKLLKEPPGRLRFLSREEAARLLAELPGEAAGVVLFALNTGMRKAEILNLTWKDINFEAGLITVERTKTNERRMIPMNREVLELLNKLRAESKGQGLVFRDGAVNLRKHFEAAVKRAGLVDFVFHDLRHTFASHLAMSGAGLRSVQQLLGHKDITMTMRYSHLSPEHLQEAVGKLSFGGHVTNLAQTDFVNLADSSKSLPGNMRL